MIHSARQARPTSTLRRTASATPSFNTDATEFSKQFAFQHLLNSPLPSPALPSIIPRHGKKPTPRLFRQAFRISVRLSTWLLAATALYCLIRAIRSPSESSASVTYLSLNVDQYNIAGQDSALQDPAPILVADPNKKPRWTVSIPRDASFPLKPSQYANICAQSDHIVKQLSPAHAHFHAGSRESQAATNFIDVQEAHDQGLLLSPSMDEARLDHSMLDEDWPRVRGKKEAGQHDNSMRPEVCEKSLTFLMESADAGMGKTLLGLWMAYGLAQDEDRAFFIDDSNWAYGKYTSFFKPPPWVFGDLIEPRSQDHQSHKAAIRKHRAFSLARVGHDALFHLAKTDTDYLSSRLAELDSTAQAGGGLTIGLHLRRGDRHPWEPQYSDSYIPAATYLSTAQSLLLHHFNPENTTLTHSAATGVAASTFLLASDDPEIYTSSDFSSAQPYANVQRAQSHILLASKDTLDAALPEPAPAPTADPAFIKFVEPNTGWEGGFFASIFWGLGNAAEGMRFARGERPERATAPPNDETLRLREYVGRAYLLELKVAGAASGGVVCGVSSFGCRVLGVMRGWSDVAEENGTWRNVDRGYSGWAGLVEEE
ncbi:MAG: hypothetical protein LQ344_005557 [Seirophora lacunosa]|nr:MAG: hypothetical protein LQ344_005557 [Seirophora lacunosa]